MKRVEIEKALNEDRNWLIDLYGAMSEEDLNRGLTASEHDPASMWSALDHFAHLLGIERVFNQLIRSHLGGNQNPMGGLVTDESGERRPLEEIMKGVHLRNEEWVESQRGKSLSEVFATAQRVRGETLALLSELSDDQLGEKLPGAPWADGTIGGVLGVNAHHSRMHHEWFKGPLETAQPG
ncbi:MAG: DinB family protein [Dehalococcoidia bacterium]